MMTILSAPQSSQEVKRPSADPTHVLGHAVPATTFDVLVLNSTTTCHVSDLGTFTVPSSATVAEVQVQTSTGVGFDDLEHVAVLSP